MVITLFAFSFTALAIFILIFLGKLIVFFWRRVLLLYVLTKKLWMKCRLKCMSEEQKKERTRKLLVQKGLKADKVLFSSTKLKKKQICYINDRGMVSDSESGPFVEAKKVANGADQDDAAEQLKTALEGGYKVLNKLKGIEGEPVKIKFKKNVADGADVEITAVFANPARQRRKSGN